MFSAFVHIIGPSSSVNPTRSSSVRPTRSSSVRPTRSSSVRPTRSSSVRPTRTKSIRPTRTRNIRPTSRTRFNSGPTPVRMVANSYTVDVLHFFTAELKLDILCWKDLVFL